MPNFMPPPEIELLQAAATKARYALEEVVPRFPAEKCDVACNVLGLYLFDKRVPNVAIIRGARPDCQDGKHLWLTCVDIIIDITADQFIGENQPPVVVTGESAWHSTLRGVFYKACDSAFSDRLRSLPLWHDSIYVKALARINDHDTTR